MPSVEAGGDLANSSVLKITEDTKNDKRHVTFSVKDNLSSNSSKKSSEDELPLSFASFYYSLKVSKGKDEREDVQKKTFAKWINLKLAKVTHSLKLTFFMLIPLIGLPLKK
jgi:hypothetical protein